jgi:hypothetical protein
MAGAVASAIAAIAVPLPVSASTGRVLAVAARECAVTAGVVADAAGVVADAAGMPAAAVTTVSISSPARSRWCGRHGRGCRRDRSGLGGAGLMPTPATAAAVLLTATGLPVRMADRGLPSGRAAVPAAVAPTSTPLHPRPRAGSRRS